MKNTEDTMMNKEVNLNTEDIKRIKLNNNEVNLNIEAMMNKAINLIGREISGTPSSAAIEPMGKTFMWYGKEETITPEEWKTYLRENIAKAMEEVYSKLVNEAADLPSLDHDLLVEYMEEYVGPQLDQVVIDTMYHVGI